VSMMFFKRKKRIKFVEAKPTKPISRNHVSILSTTYDGAFVANWGEIFESCMVGIPRRYIGTPAPTGLGNLALYHPDEIIGSDK
jgi:hypothetical protein